MHHIFVEEFKQKGEMKSYTSRRIAKEECDKLEGSVVVRHEGSYHVCDSESIPEGSIVMYREASVPKSNKLKAKALQVPKKVKKKLTEEEMEEMINLSPIDDGEEKVFVVDRGISGIEMNEKEVEMELAKVVAPRKKKSKESLNRKKKVVVRQSEMGVVTVVTIDLRVRPLKELVEEIGGLDECERTVPTGGAVHAYPKTPEHIAELMESVIELVNKWYSKEEYQVQIDRI